jgi:hypothetical protein
MREDLEEFFIFECKIKKGENHKQFPNSMDQRMPTMLMELGSEFSNEAIKVRA